MTLTVTQANAVNRLAAYLLSFDLGDDSHVEALNALSTLIPDAYKRLHAGFSPERYADAVNAWDTSTTTQGAQHGR